MAKRKRRGLAREFLDFLKDNKMWWLSPIILVLLLLMGIVIMSATGAVPFMYTLF